MVSFPLRFCTHPRSQSQVDDPAIREGLPLKTNRQAAYLEWAAASFRLSTGVATSACQIVTHLCYSDFGECKRTRGKENKRKSEEGVYITHTILHLNLPQMTVPISPHFPP